MTDEHLIKTIQTELPFLRERGYANTSANVAALIKRFETLAECHRLLGEREERLTVRLVELER